MAAFDIQAGHTYIYPTNYPIREYQFDIVKAALFKNTLVCLPTGLGKTFIGAVLMYNFYRWYPTGKVVFLAPTRPLVGQQIEACFHVMGIPQEHTTEMTGTTAPETRQVIWQNKRVFFLTPQVLMNDLSRGTCPVKVIKLIVIDEAHKALGNHSFCQVMKQMKQQCYNFRVVALSATPGSDIQAVQQVVSNLMISHIELRNEDSPDILQYTHLRNIEKIVIPIQGELKRIADKYLEILKYYVFKLINHHVLYAKDETSITKFQLLKAREAFRQDPPAGCNKQTIGMLEGTFALCMTLYHAYELLLMHGIWSFFKFLKGSLEDKKGHFYGKGELTKNPLFMELLESLETYYKNAPFIEGQTEANTLPVPSTTSVRGNGYFISHPKMEKLQQILLDHFSHYQKMNQSTRVMIFSQYRDSVTEITDLLRTHEPLIKPMSFLGQSVKAGKGITQKEQIRVIKQFRDGCYNTLISTCVGEEGLDIGEVDLIICYDAPKSPVRLVQRMGRTGRKRDGKIVVLVTQGKEDKSYMTSQYQKKSLTKALLRGDRLAQYLFPNSPRMIPDEIDPVCLKLKMQERTYNVSSKGSGRRQKGTVNAYFRSRSTSKPNAPWLSESELKAYKENYKVDLENVPKIPRPSCGFIENQLRDSSDGRQVIDLSDFQPWYTTLQACHELSHSKVTRSLVHLTGFINLQMVIGDNDNYSIEMAPFLQEKYLKDPENADQTNSRNMRKKSNDEDPERSRPGSHHAKRRNERLAKRTKSINEKRRFKKGIESFLIKTNHSNVVSSLLPPDLNSQAAASDRDHLHLNNSLDSKCLDDAPRDLKTCNEVDLLDESDLVDFELPAQWRTEKNGMNRQHHQLVPTFPDIENVFSSFTAKEKIKVSFLCPPTFCKARQKSLFLHPSRVSKANIALRQKAAVVVCHHLGSYFREFTLPDLLKRKAFPLTPSLNSELCKVFASSKITSSDEVEIIDLERLEPNDTTKKSSLIWKTYNKIYDNKVSAARTFPSDVASTGKRTPRICPNYFSGVQIFETAAKCYVKEEKTLNESSVLLTPPPATTESINVVENATLLCTSPCFTSRRPTWIEHSPLIVSSTPVTNGAKKLFGNSSVNITPISLDSKDDKFASAAREEERQGPKKNFTTESIATKSVKDDAMKPDGRFQLEGKDKMGEDSRNQTAATEVNFQLSLDDEFFANIDLDNILQESVDKSLVKKDQIASENSSSRSNDTVNNNNESHFKTEKSQSLLTVTQVIDLLNEPNCALSSTLEKPASESQRDLKLKKNVSSGGRTLACEDKVKKPSTESSNENITLPPVNRSDPKRKLYDDYPKTNGKDRNFNGVNQNSDKNASSSSIDVSKTSKGERQHAFSYLSRPQAGNIDAQIKSSERETKIQFHFGLDGFEDILDDFTHSAKEDEKNLIGNNSEDLFKDVDESSNSNNNRDEPLTRKPHIAEPESLRSVGSIQPFMKSDNQSDQEGHLSSFHRSSLKKGHLGSGSRDAAISISVDCNAESKHSTPVVGIATKVIVSQMQALDKMSSDNSNGTLLEDSPVIRRKKTKFNRLGSQFGKNSMNVSSNSEKNSFTASNSSSSNGPAFDIPSDDNFEVPFAPRDPQPQPRVKNIENGKARKNKKRRNQPCLVDMEAGVVNDSVVISTDESESSLDDYDSSFVDDEVPQTQQGHGIDMQAVYLQSVRSPLKRTLKVDEHEERSENALDQTEDDFYSDDEKEDSFVVENDVIEYDTEFLGESMLAVDPIINQEIENKARRKLSKKPQKRRRLIHFSDSSEDERNSPKKPKLVAAPSQKIASGSLDTPISTAVLTASPSSPKTMVSEVITQPQVGMTETEKAVEGGPHFDIVSSFDDDFVRPSSVVKKNTFPKSPSLRVTLEENGLSQKAEFRRATKAFDFGKDHSGEGSDSKKREPTTKETSPKLGTKRKFGKRSLSCDHFGNNPPQNATEKCLSSSQEPFRLKRPSLFSRLNNALPSFRPSPTASANSSVLPATSSVKERLSQNNQFPAQVPSGISFGNLKTTSDILPSGTCQTSNSDISSVSGTSAGPLKPNKTCIVVDSTEVSIAGIITSTLRLRFGLQTYVSQATPASYVISSRMAVFRQNYFAFANSVNRSRLVSRFRVLLHTYDKLVVILENDSKAGSQLPPRTFYMDTISCACAQLPQLKVLLASDQEETADIIWHLTRQEKLKGYSIPCIPAGNQQFEQALKFYRSISKISCSSGIFLALNFPTIQEAVNSDLEQLKAKGRLSMEVAFALKTYFTRPFRKDFLQSNLKNEAS